MLEPSQALRQNDAKEHRIEEGSENDDQLLERMSALSNSRYHVREGKRGFVIIPQWAYTGFYRVKVRRKWHIETGDVRRCAVVL